MAHEHIVYDMGTHFVIDPITRKIRLKEGDSLPVIVQYDHNSERCTFELPKLVDGHDMRLCNAVRVQYINIDSATRESKDGVYNVDDLAILAGSDDTVACSWLISDNATQYAGKLNFALQFMCKDDAGNITYRWQTEIFGDMTVSSGMDNGETVVEEHADILAQWEAKLFGVGDTVEQQIINTGEAVKASIPADYAELTAQADNTDRSKAPAIVLTAEGKSIAVHDASDCYLKGLRIFGKSTQDGTPTPDAPVEIVSVENASVKIHSRNLAWFTDTTETWNGITWTVKGGAFTANGTSTDISATGKIATCDLTGLVGTFFVSGSTSNISVLVAVDKNGTMAWYNGQSFTLDGTEASVVVYCQIGKGVTVNETVRPMVNIGKTAEAWEIGEPRQSMQLAHTMRGIPVSSGGNYTDANGQQWIADEVDLKRGVYVQRVYEAEIAEESVEYGTAYGDNGYFDFTLFYPSDDVTSKAAFADYAKFTHFPTSYEYREEKEYGYCANTRIKIFSNRWASKNDFSAWLTAQQGNGTPVSIMYILATPIETALSETELAAFKVLHSNCPNTTVLNDVGTHMAVEYVADTKTYIDNKIAEMMQS